MTASLRDAPRDRYTIEGELGRGRMATVYLARDLKHDREVALKVLHPQLAASLRPERFLREIKVAARFNHPHILPLHDSGQAGELLYYVMPYVEGESLRQRLSRESSCRSRTRSRSHGTWRPRSTMPIAIRSCTGTSSPRT